MDYNDAEIQLSMICRSKCFKELDLDGIILHIVERSDKNIQKWYFEKGSRNNLPDSLEKFIDELKSFIQERGIYQIKRYSEESWIDYLMRIKHLKDSHRISNDEIIRKLRSEEAPQTIESIFYSSNEFDDIFSRVDEFSKNKKFEKINAYPGTVKHDKKRPERSEYKIHKEFNFNKRIIVCFKCGKPSHYARNCYSTNEMSMFNKQNEENLDMRFLKLNNIKMRVLFDTGSSINIITKNTLNRLKDLEIEKLEKEVEIKLLNGSCIKSKDSVLLNLKYNDKDIVENFFIIEKGIVDIIVGQKLIKKLSNKRQIFTNRM
ncbi:hypothetical protein DMUE_3767 [Dictyocoela muelleri]|nr:hypothetical protein DMUE_3767 [Dictyocoela muelleri]